MDKHSIGKTIAQLRKAKGWTQAELAEQLNVSDKAVSKWESEAGFPEFTMFPLLANLFGVSIDYLMTGKEPEAVIITMSKAELCAKNDDVTLLKEIDFAQKDESNKCLIDYIKQYESLKVFSALCATDDRAKGSFDLLTFLKFCLLSNHLELLDKKGFWLKPQICSYRFDSAEDIMGLMPVGALEHFGKRPGNDQYVCVLPNDFFTMIATDKRINETTIDFLLGKQRGRKCVWYHAFPYLIDACYEGGNADLLERLLTLSEENNQYAYDNLKDTRNYVYNYYFIGFQYSKVGHGLVRILDKTLKAALQKNDFAMIERMNSLNKSVIRYYGGFECGVVSDDEIRVAKLKLDKSVSTQDIIIQSSIHNGIVVIDELLAVNDANLIAKTLENYPVSKYELKYTVLEEMREAVESDDWRFVFEYAVDNNEESLAYYVINNQKEEIISWISDKEKLPIMGWGRTAYDFFRQNEKESTNSKYFQLRSKERFSGEMQVSSYYLPQKRNSKTIYDLHDLVEYIKLCKKQVVDDFKASHNAGKIIEEISEEFLRDELAKDNTELVAIKLCVRLEAVLKSKYHYEGDFSEMLEKYCSEHGVREEDDGWGYVTARTEKFVSYLQKLRKYRNSIVHSEKKVDAMTKEELEFCIQYICGLK